MSATMLVITVGSVFVILSFIAILDVSRLSYKRPWEQYVWLGAVVLVPFAGCVAYFALGRWRGVKRTEGE
jgi:hypothetical protein